MYLSRTIWQPQRQWWPVVLQGARSQSLPLTCRELFPNWVSSLTRSLIIGPIIRDRARPVARDSNGRSLTRQLFRVFCRPFPTFRDPAHDSVPLSGLHYRILHGIRPQVLCLSGTRPPGSLLAQRQLQIWSDKHNSIRQRGRERRYNLCARITPQAVLATPRRPFSSVHSSPRLGWDSPHSHCPSRYDS